MPVKRPFAGGFLWTRLSPGRTFAAGRTVRRAAQLLRSQHRDARLADTAHVQLRVLLMNDYTQRAQPVLEDFVYQGREAADFIGLAGMIRRCVRRRTPHVDIVESASPSNRGAWN